MVVYKKLSVQECVTDCSQITSCMPCPFVWESSPPGMGRSKALPPPRPENILHVLTYLLLLRTLSKGLVWVMQLFRYLREIIVN